MHVTNTVPQMQAFNSPIWLALEDYALGHAKEDDMKIYLPAPKGGGGSNPGPRSPGGAGAFPTYTTPAQNDEEKAKRAYEKEQALLARMPHLKQQ